MDSSRQLYFKELNIDPLRLLLSFVFSPQDKTSILNGRGNPFRVLKNLQAAVSSVGDAPITLKEVVRDNLHGTVRHVVDRLYCHYYQSALREFYKVLFATDILGSPACWLTNVSLGVRDLFNEPVHALMDESESFTSGVKKGSKSFVSNTSSGTANSVSKFTGSLAKGRPKITKPSLAAITHASSGMSSVTGHAVVPKHSPETMR